MFCNRFFYFTPSEDSQKLPINYLTPSENLSYDKRSSPRSREIFSKSNFQLLSFTITLAFYLSFLPKQIQELDMVSEPPTLSCI